MSIFPGKAAISQMTWQYPHPYWMGATQIVPRELALLESIGQPFAQIAAEIGMSLSMLRNWPMAHLHQIDAKEGPETALETLTKKDHSRRTMRRE